MGDQAASQVFYNDGSQLLRGGRMIGLDGNPVGLAGLPATNNPTAEKIERGGK